MLALELGESVQYKTNVAPLEASAAAERTRINNKKLKEQSWIETTTCN